MFEDLIGWGALMAGDGPRVGLRNLGHLVRTHPLTKDHQLSTVGRILRWQAASRLWGGELVVPFVNDSQMLVSTSMHGATGNYYAGLFEFEQMAFALHLLRPDDLFADVGANVGAYTVLASGGRRARTIAIEPTSAAASALRRNVAINDLADLVTVEQIAASDRAGSLSLSIGDDTTTHVVTGDGPADLSEHVQADTLDHVLGGAIPSLIKIDVEGWERSVLLGAPTTLAHPDLVALIVETNDLGANYGVEGDDVDGILAAAGFTKVTYDPRTRSIEPRSSASADPNTIFVRDLAIVGERLAAAPPFQVIGQSI